jgi:cell division protein ZapB
LTGLDFPNYIPPMDAELSALEEKVRQAAELCQRLREENRTLRQQLSQLELDRERLTSKVEGARERLESLLRQIPE